MAAAIRAGLAYFALVFGAGFALGALRVLWIAPRIGTRAAELAEMPVMLAISALAAAWTVRRFAVAPAGGRRLAMGGVALALMLAAELVLLPLLRGPVVAEVDPFTSSFYSAALALFAILPLFVPPAASLRVRLLVAFLVLGSAIPAGIAYQYYRHDLAVERLRVSIGARIAQTACGPVEYASIGEGPSLLVVHGAGGGYDQGLELLGALASQGFRIVAMSRFGYLNTPLPADASPAAQADAHACLLDALKIERAAILGASAGAPSTLQFALRHPRRASAMVLLVPLAYAPGFRHPGPPPSGAARFMFEAAVKSDLLFWLAMRLSPDTVLKTLLATPPGLLQQADAAERARIEGLMRHILPLSRRQAGLLNEGRVVASLERYPLERVAVPTLVISAADDGYRTYESGKYTAENIPGGRFVGYETGGHMLVGRTDAVLTEIKRFLAGRATMAGKP